MIYIKKYKKNKSFLKVLFFFKYNSIAMFNLGDGNIYINLWKFDHEYEDRNIFFVINHEFMHKILFEVFDKNEEMCESWHGLKELENELWGEHTMDNIFEEMVVGK